MAKKFDTLLEADDIASQKTGDRQFVTALARGLEVLRAFKPEDGPLGNQELAERTGLPKPTVSRITHTLTTLGYLDYMPRLSRYAIAPSVLALGHQCVLTAGIRRSAHPPMQALAEYADATVALGARDRLSMIYLDVARGSRTVAFSLDAGAHVPLHNTAMGAALLWALPKAEREFLLGAISQANKSEWTTIKRRLNAAFKAIDATGFCMFEGTYERAMNGVGCALLRPDGAVNAFSCSAPVFEFTRERMADDIGPRLVAMCAAIRADWQRECDEHMLKLIYLAKRKPGFSVDEFVRRWRKHGALGMEQSLWRFALGYVQAEPIRPALIAGASDEFDAVATYMVRDDMFTGMTDEDMPGALRMAEDELETFSGPIPGVSLWVSEEHIRAGELGGVTAFLFFYDVAAARDITDRARQATALHRITLNLRDDRPLGSRANTLPFAAVVELVAAGLPALAKAVFQEGGGLLVAADLAVVTRAAVLWDRITPSHSPT